MPKLCLLSFTAHQSINNVQNTFSQTQMHPLKNNIFLLTIEKIISHVLLSVWSLSLKLWKWLNKDLNFQSPLPQSGAQSLQCIYTKPVKEQFIIIHLCAFCGLCDFLLWSRLLVTLIFHYSRISLMATCTLVPNQSSLTLPSVR